MTDWIKVTGLETVPALGSRIVKTDKEEIAIFRGSDDQVFAIKNECPHKKGPLSEGIMHGDSVTCPLHNWTISLKDGHALGADEGCTNVYEVKVENQQIYLKV